jgi:hypothetical protein
MGEVPPYDDDRITHGYCQPCFNWYMDEIDRMTPPMATKGQLKVIHIYRRKVFGDDSEYRYWLNENFGVNSTKDLNKRDASECIQLLSGSGTHSRRKSKYHGSGIVGYQRNLTQPQADRIEALEIMLGWTGMNTTQFIKKQIGALKDVSWLMNHEAVKVIVGMQRILSGGDEGEYKRINSMTNHQLFSAEQTKELQC